MVSLDRRELAWRIARRAARANPISVVHFYYVRGDQGYPICGTWRQLTRSSGFAGTRDWSEVTCKKCLAKRPKSNVVGAPRTGQTKARIKFALRQWGVPGELTDQMDLDAHIDSKLSTEENLENLKEIYPSLQRYARGTQAALKREEVYGEEMEKGYYERREEELISGKLEGLKDAVWKLISGKYPSKISQAKFDGAWQRVEGTGILEKLFPKPMDVAPATPPPKPTSAVITAHTEIDEVYSYIVGRERVKYEELVDKMLLTEDTEANRIALDNSIGTLLKEGWIEKEDEETYIPMQPTRVTTDLVKNNLWALNRAQRGDLNFQEKDLVNSMYNGLGVEYKGTMGRIGLAEKREITLQQFYTDPALTKMIVDMLKIPQVATVFDPSCGGGRLLYACPNHRNCYGIEIEGKAYTVAKSIMPDAHIIQSSTIYHVWKEPVFDYILTNPPFSITWEDELMQLQFTSSTNRVPSHIATMEICVKALNEGGVMAAIVPNSTMGVIRREADFWEWFLHNMDCIGVIELPSNWYKTASSIAWGCTLYIFRKQPRGGNRSAFDPQVVHIALHGLEPNDIQDAIMKFHHGSMRGQYTDDQRIGEFLEHTARNVEELEEPIEFKTIDVYKLRHQHLFGINEAITKDDVVSLSVEDTGRVESFKMDYLKPVPNGLGASMKIANIGAYYPQAFSTVKKEWIDIFRRDILPISNVLAGRESLDDHLAIQGFRAYDMNVVRSPEFEKFIEVKSEWYKFQETPFEHWADSMLNGKWQQFYADAGLKAKYPERWTAQKERFEDLAKTYPWFDTLFGYQKEDVVKLSLKASAIDISTMGTGKTRKAIATAILKGFDHNLIVAPSRLIPNWIKEFTEELHMDPPYLLQYEDDLKEAGKHRFCIVGMTTLAKPPRIMPASVHGLSQGERVKLMLGEELEEEDEGQAVFANPDEGVNEPWSGAEDMEDLSDIQAIDSMLAAGEEIPGENPEAEEPVSKEAVKEIAKAEAGAEKEIIKQRMKPFFSKRIQNFDYCIVDEAHYLSNPITARTNAVACLEAKQWLCLTGTPIMNRILGLFSLLDICWGRETPAFPYSPRDWMTDFMTFANAEERSEIEAKTLRQNFDAAAAERVISSLHDTYVETLGYGGGGGRKEQKVLPLPIIRNPDKLRNLMAGKWLRRTQFEPEVQADRQFIKPDIETVAVDADKSTVEFYGEWMKAYERYFDKWKEYMKDRQKKMAPLELESEEEDEEEVGEFASPKEKKEKEEKSEEEMPERIGAPGLQAIGVLQMAALMPQYDGLDRVKWEVAGSVIRTPGRFHGRIPTARQRWVIENASKWAKQGKKVYCVAHFRMFLGYMQSEIEKTGVKALVITGEIDIKKRQAILDEFANSTEPTVLLGTSGVLDVGLNIPQADIAVICSPLWNWSMVSQTIGRMLRPKSKGKKKAYILYEKGSIEFYVKSIMELKKTSMDEVEDRIMVETDVKWISWIALMMVAIEERERGIIR